MTQNMVPAAQVYFNQGMMSSGDPSFQSGVAMGQVIKKINKNW